MPRPEPRLPAGPHGLPAPPAARQRPPEVRRVRVDEAQAGQRLDNYLIRALKGVPRSHIYRLIRDGQVRVNAARVDVTCRLAAGDEVRIPPTRTAAVRPGRPVPLDADELPVLFEDSALIVVNKPAGLAVHGGSGVAFGVIERLRAARPEAPMLELVHRLDRETSGLLLVAKKRSALTALHAAWGGDSIQKVYLALVKGRFGAQARLLDLPLRKYVSRGGERRVSVDRSGQSARTRVSLVQAGPDCSLVRAALETGRTHQIRVHLAHVGHPILGDEKYGDFDLNRALARAGLKRMVLHAAELRLKHPLSGEPLRFEARLPQDLEAVCTRLLREGLPAAGPRADAGPMKGDGDAGSAV